MKEKKLFKVLHVDDEPGLLKIAKQCLEMQGPFQVDTACSVEEALEKMKKESYEAVVSDYRMPGKDGLQFLKEVRESRNDIPFVIFTGKGREEVAIRAWSLGANHYVNKNANPELVYSELSHCLSEAVEKHAAETQARETAQKLQAIYENAVEGISLADPQENLVYVNKAFADILGCKENHLVGTNLRRFVDDENWTKIRNETESRQKGKANRYELVFHRPDGSSRNVQISASPLFDSCGRFAGTVGIVLDVTELNKTEEELRKNEEKLRESEERFRALYEGIHDPVAIYVGKEGHLVDYNPAYKKLSGYTDEELKDTTYLSLAHPDDKAFLQEKYNTKHREDEFPLVFEERAVDKKGEVKYLEASVSQYRKKGRVIGIEVIHRDIGDRKKAERAILENQENFKALFAGNPVAAVHVGPDFCILDVNPRFEMLFGYRLDEVKGRNINDVVVPKDKVDEAEMLNCIAEQDKHVSQATVRRRKDGSLVPVLVSAAQITVEGRHLGYVAVYKDISELTRTEAAMKEMMQKLATMNEKLHVVGSLTRHDVRNKLSIVTGNIFLAKKRLSDSPVISEYLHDIDSACRQILEIFEFAHSYESLGVEELVYVDVGKTVDEAVMLFPDLNINITNNCSGLTVLADSFLRQMFYNLIDNSLKHGGKTSRIRIRYEETSPDELRLYYEDDGLGVPETAKPNLFKEGFTTGKGTGYGLYLIKKMMEVYGWKILETGKPGKGAQFTITIPRTNQNTKENYRIDAHD